MELKCRWPQRKVCSCRFVIVQMEMHNGSIKTLMGVIHILSLSCGLIPLRALDAARYRCILGGGILKVVRRTPCNDEGER